MRRTWDDNQVDVEVRQIAKDLGHFPSRSELSDRGRNDLAMQIQRRGGFIHWAGRIGIGRLRSNSDTGWEGESQAAQRLADAGFSVARATGVKSPFDLLLNGLLRIDVKSARRATYGACSGWFYRLGKIPQSDVIFLWQLDTGDFYSLPWFICPRTNITISVTGGKYIAYRNNLQIIRDMLVAREAERDRLRAIAAAN